MNKPSPIVADDQYKARFTAAEFLALVESGGFGDMKIELVDGELERMNPPMSMHAKLQLDILYLLRDATRGSPRSVVGEVGIDLGGDTILGCDGALLRGQVDANRMLRSEDVLLAIEVAITTLSRDLGMKRRKYAEAGIAHYWVVDGNARMIRIFSSPVDGEYRSQADVGFTDPIPVPGTDRTITLA